MGLIACSYRAAEWRHKEIKLTAVELLQYLDTKSEVSASADRPRRRRVPDPPVGDDIDAMMDCGYLPSAVQLRRAGLRSVSQ